MTRTGRAVKFLRRRVERKKRRNQRGKAVTKKPKNGVEDRLGSKTRSAVSTGQLRAQEARLVIVSKGVGTG